MRKEIIPAIIAKTQDELDERINKVKDHALTLQLDIMDGQFVQNSSLNFPFSLPETSCRLEAHLMINDPESWVHENAGKFDTILAPIETTKDSASLVKAVKGHGKRVGFALNPETGIDAIQDMLESIDQVLILTVKPGAYGSQFIPDALEKVRELRKLAPELNIEVDGSINTNTIRQALDAGANLFVVGSFIINSDDPVQAIAVLKKEIEKEADTDGRT